MTEDPQPDTENRGPGKSEVERLRDEFAEQFATMKAAYEGKISELTSSLDDLRNHNTELERALLRSATVTPAEPPAPPKSEQELYDERVAAIARKAASNLGVKEN